MKKGELTKMKTIPLTHGKVALVDSEDYNWLLQFKWRAQKSGKRHDAFYAVRNVTIKKRRTTIQMHKQIMHPPHGLEIDHKNNNGLDNRRSNLRFCTRSQNMANSRGHRRRFSSFKGVSFHKQFRKWRTIITQNKKNLHLGFFRSQVRAAKAYDDKAKELFGQFARPNFPYRIRRKNICRWLMATNGRIFSITLIKTSTGRDKTMLARMAAKKRLTGQTTPSNPPNMQLITLFDLIEQTHKRIPTDQIVAVTCRGRAYRVD
jgi:hypothetical protein